MGCHMRPEPRAEPGSHRHRTLFPVGSGWGLGRVAGSPGDAREAGAQGYVGQKRGDKWKGQVGPGLVAAASDRGRKLVSETPSSLASAVSPGAPTGTAAARKGVVNGVLFGLLVI